MGLTASVNTALRPRESRGSTIPMATLLLLLLFLSSLLPVHFAAFQDYFLVTWLICSNGVGWKNTLLI
jgi:hypothetical protein